MTHVRSNSHFERPAIFLVNGLGDQLIGLPAMRALSTIFPTGLQLLLGEGMFAFFYRGLPVGEPVRVWWEDFGTASIDVNRTAKQANPCDLFLSLSTWAKPAVAELARRMGASSTAGYFDVFDDRVEYDESAHMCDRLFAIPQHFQPGLRFDDYSSPPTFSPAAEQAARRFVGAHVSPGERILFVHPETHRHKMWNAQSFSWVLARFLDVHPEFKVVVPTWAPHPFDLGCHGHRLIHLNEHLELALAVLKHADLFLGVDSCFLHAADLFRVPGVGLFGPTAPHHWGFRLSPKSRALTGGGSMEGIHREPVLNAMLEVAMDPPRSERQADELRAEG